jgi:uncharacterized protein YndB with AHSA1/START domain
MLARENPEVTVTLPSETEIRFTCIFQRKRQTLFEAWTRPEHIRNWYGCEDSTVEECEVDLRVGGAWRIVVRMADKSKHHFHGMYREVVQGERLVYSECYEAPQFGNPTWIATVTFEEVDGGVRLTHTIRHRSREMRDGHLQSGMEPGMIASLHRLDKEAEQMATGNGGIR